MKRFEVMRKWCKKIEIEVFDKWLISLDYVTYVKISQQIIKLEGNVDDIPKKVSICSRPGHT